jgi:predicted SAM-dependent methyltransferase
VIHQNIKDAYYLLLYPLSKVLRPIYRAHYKLARRKRDKTQIGCGPNYIEGFVNIDANLQRKVDYLLDVRCGLPFPDNSISFIYSCHMLEHLHITDAINLLKECRRVLTPDGYMRLTLPDFEFVFRILAGDEQCDFPRNFTSRQGQAINFLFCDGQHKYGFTKEIVQEVALQLGFSKVVTATADDSNIPNLQAIEPPGSFSVNIFKTINA